MIKIFVLSLVLSHVSGNGVQFTDINFASHEECIQAKKEFLSLKDFNVKVVTDCEER